MNAKQRRKFERELQAIILNTLPETFNKQVVEEVIALQRENTKLRKIINDMLIKEIGNAATRTTS